jgi:23S rRNA (uracil747-C5)-methyltransferase
VVNNFIPFLQATQLTPYHIKEKKGELKGLILYYSDESGEMYLRFILRSKESLDRLKKHVHLLTSQFPFIKCLSANIQPIPHAILEGEEEIFLTGSTDITHNLGKISMQLSPQGFVQTNQRVAQSLYETAAGWVKEKNVQKFMELFSGQGAFSFFIEDSVKEALGIEVNPKAVERANISAMKNDCQHLVFKAMDAAMVDHEIAEFKPDLILVNPPRRGLGESVLTLIKNPPKYLIYSSCSSPSLAKDVTLLSSLYCIEKVQIFDMFPHTPHFETLMLLKLNGVDKDE